MRILYVNHTGAYSGAENAMLRLLEAIPAEHERGVACPPEGGLAKTLAGRNIRQYDFAGTDVSLALHPVNTPVGLYHLARSALTLRRIAREFGADVLHANSVRAGLIAVMAHRLGGPPVVVQCHDHLPRSRAGDLSRRAVAGGAEVVIGVTDQTAAHFNAGLAHAKAERVYISFDHSQFSPDARGKSSIRADLGLAEGASLLAHVAQITPWKGQATSIRALSKMPPDVDAHLMIVGEVAFSSRRYDNVAYNDSLHALCTELGVNDRVHFLGRRQDVAELMAASDLLVLPSWDEPFGLVVAEAMACGTPVLVTEKGGVCEYVQEGVQGRVLSPENPGEWADAATVLLRDPPLRHRMGQAAIEAVADFTDERYADEMLLRYRRAASH